MVWRSVGVDYASNCVGSSPIVVCEVVRAGGDRRSFGFDVGECRSRTLKLRAIGAGPNHHISTDGIRAHKTQIKSLLSYRLTTVFFDFTRASNMNLKLA